MQNMLVNVISTFGSLDINWKYKLMSNENLQNKQNFNENHVPFVYRNINSLNLSDIYSLYPNPNLIINFKLYFLYRISK